MHRTFADKAISFHAGLNPVLHLPDNVDLLNPFRSDDVMRHVRAFYHQYFDDTLLRFGIFGINPGRFGAGLTGLSFTDPVALRTQCGIDNQLGDRTELSSEFVYMCIKAFGGPTMFFKHFYLSAVCPLGFVRHGVNANFYDDSQLQQSAEPFILESLRTQCEFPLHRQRCICLGRGKLRTFMTSIQKTYSIFDDIEYLDHPRFIMQYRRSKLAAYVDEYCRCFERCEKLGLANTTPIT